MTPVERAAAVYQREACARSFREDLEAHLLHGLVFSTPDSFVMARPVWAKAPKELIVDPWFNDFAVKDAWHLYLFSGPLENAFKAAPYILPWVTFERNNILRRYEWDVISQKCARFFSSSSRLLPQR